MAALLDIARLTPRQALDTQPGSASRCAAFRHGQGFKQGGALLAAEEAQRLAQGWQALLEQHAPPEVRSGLQAHGDAGARARLSAWAATLSWAQFSEWSRLARIDVLLAALGSPGPKAPVAEAEDDAEAEEEKAARAVRGPLPGDCFPEQPAVDEASPPIWPQLQARAAQAVEACLAALRELPPDRGRGPIKPSREDLEAAARRWVEAAQRCLPPHVTLMACLRHAGRAQTALTLMRNVLPQREQELTPEQQVAQWRSAVRDAGWPQHGSDMVDALVATDRHGAVAESHRALRTWLDAVQGLLAELCGATYREFYMYCLRRAGAA